VAEHVEDVMMRARAVIPLMGSARRILQGAQKPQKETSAPCPEIRGGGEEKHGLQRKKHRELKTEAGPLNAWQPVARQDRIFAIPRNLSLSDG